MKFKLQQPLGMVDIPARIMLGLLALLSGYSYTFGPKSSHVGPLYSALHVIHVPLLVYGIGLIVSGLIIFLARTAKERLIGFLMGAVIYSTFALLLLTQYHPTFGPVTLSGIALTAFAAGWYWFISYRITKVDDGSW